MATELNDAHQFTLGELGGGASEAATPGNATDGPTDDASGQPSPQQPSSPADGASSPQQPADQPRKRGRRSNAQILADAAATAPAAGSVGNVTAPTFPAKRSHKSTAERIAAGEKIGKPDPSAAKLAAARESSSQILAVVETLAITFAGEDAALKDTERYMIEQSLPAVLAQMTPAASAAIAQYTPGAMLLAGAGLYTFRVLGLLTIKARNEQAQRAAAARAIPQQPAASSNGASPAAAPAANSTVPVEVDGRAFISSRGLDG